MANWGTGFNTGFESVRHFGLKYVQIFAGEANEVNFWHLEAESSLRIESVVRTAGDGLPRIVAYKLSLTLYIPNNEYNPSAADFEELRASRLLTNVHVGMGSAIHDINEASGFWFPTLTSGVPTPVDPADIEATLMALRCTNIVMETIERRPRAIVTLEGLYSKRLFESDILPGFFNA